MAQARVESARVVSLSRSRRDACELRVPPSKRTLPGTGAESVEQAQARYWFALRVALRRLAGRAIEQRVPGACSIHPDDRMLRHSGVVGWRPLTV